MQRRKSQKNKENLWFSPKLQESLFSELTRWPARFLQRQRYSSGLHGTRSGHTAGSSGPTSSGPSGRGFQAFASLARSRARQSSSLTATPVGFKATIFSICSSFRLARRASWAAKMALFARRSLYTGAGDEWYRQGRGAGSDMAAGSAITVC